MARRHRRGVKKGSKKAYRHSRGGHSKKSLGMEHMGKKHHRKGGRKSKRGKKRSKKR